MSSNPKFTEEQLEFQTYCRNWLVDNTPVPPPVELPQSPLEIMSSEQMAYLRAWQHSAYKAGLVGCDYPKEYGGGGRINCQAIANSEMNAVATPYFPNEIGLRMAAPTLLLHAQEDVKRKLLPRLLSGEHIWCQGFSEPGAGSDLANVQTFAERKADKWVINGSKVWTSLAQFSEWMILLARTERSDKYGGMTYFVVPILSEIKRGVSVRPLIKMTGEAGFNEVFFDNLEIDDKYRLDDIGKGWQVAMTTLAHERGAGKMIAPRSGSSSNKSPRADTALFGSTELIDLASKFQRNGRPASEDGVIRDRIMNNIIREEAFKQSRRRARVSTLCDHPQRLPLQSKLVSTEIIQDVAGLALEIEGASGSNYTIDGVARAESRWPLAYMNSFGKTIYAGTNEIQRNILGERVLGLPKTK